MQRLTSQPRRPFRAAAGLLAAAFSGCAASPHPTPAAATEPVSPTADAVVIRSPAGTKRPPFRFTTADDRLLDDVERGAFWFLWNESSPSTGMVVDRSSVKFASTAGVGFQLAALPVGIERGWVSREAGQARALKILTALGSNPDNRKAGLFYHYLTPEDASPVPQDVVSTIDSSLLFAGVLVAGGYFGGEVRAIGDRLFAAADWSFFVEHSPKAHEPHMAGFLSLGWKPKDFKQPTGAGALTPYYWADSGDEHRLVCFLAACAPEDGRRADPQLYWKLRRTLGEYATTGPMVYLPWSGAMFINFFAQCFINYSALGPDSPKAHGIERRPGVDWWENSRRAVELHRIKAREASSRFPNLGENAWGLTACDTPAGYGVPGVYPTPLLFPELRPDLDFPKWTSKDDFAGGTLGCYGAGCCIMFNPDAALAALRHYQSLKNPAGDPLVWREPSPEPGRNSYGFLDSFNSATGWVAKDYVAIDQGPLLLAIENARTGRVWSWFHAHPFVQAGLKRLGLSSPPASERP